MDNASDLDSIRAPAASKIFCSYRRADNDTIFRDTVDHLVADMKSLHEAETGRTLEIFFDREELGWGDDFREVIDRAVQEATFFMPIVTARYFDSEWCRHEFLTFYRKARILGVTELILPIVLAGASFVRTDSSDKVASTIAAIQHADWSNLWQEGRGSAAWRSAVTELVRRIVDLRALVETQLNRQVLNQTRLENLTEGEDFPTDPVRRRQPSEVVQALGSKGSSVLNGVERVMRDVITFFAALDEAVRALDGPGGRGNSGLSDGFVVDAHSIELAARDMLTDALDFDAALQTQLRLTCSPASRMSLGRVVVDVRDRAAGLEDLSNGLLYAPALIRKLDSTLRMRPIASLAQAIMKTIRDLIKLLYEWIALDVRSLEPADREGRITG
ncbi:TIR domain-containing protein [Nonomuraea sp. NPDC049421]|uniref:TIR domain-containing protein n=1 Tax=Nonomuraea sp. NPDC049421 TaxID=3155275 RepID=UPI003419ACF6